jgi:hypothetical protein
MALINIIGQTGSAVDPVALDEAPVTLSEAGIDKHLADKARKFAARTDEEFETFIGKALQKVTDGVEGRRPNLTPGDAAGNTKKAPDLAARSALCDQSGKGGKSLGGNQAGDIGVGNSSRFR